MSNCGWFVCEYDGVKSLRFQSDNVDITINSELEWKGLKPNIGYYDTNPSNGGFRLTWNETIVTVDISRSGDGRGGYISLELDSKGFKKCLKDISGL